MKIIFLSIFIIVFSSCALIGKACTSNKSDKVTFYDQLPNSLVNQVEKISSLICILDEKPKSDQTLKDSCHSMFKAEALNKGGSIIVIDPREVRPLGGRGGCFIDGIGAIDCPENIYMYGTLYKHK